MRAFASSFRTTRFVVLLEVAATIGAVTSVVIAGLAVSSLFEARRLPTQAGESSRASTPVRAPAPTALPPLDHSAWDALPAPEPIEVDSSSFDDENAGPRIAMAFDAGRAVGFKVSSIRAGSAYARLGLRNGDVVRRINGMEISSAERGLEVYGKLKDAKELRVDVDRGGEAIRLEYVLGRRCAASTIGLSRAEVDGMLASFQQPTTSCGIVPAFKGGMTIGFKLFSVRPGSFGERLCLQNGDVVTHMNGNSLASPERALAVYAGLRQARRVDVDVLRGGAPLRITYLIEH